MDINKKCKSVLILFNGIELVEYCVESRGSLETYLQITPNSAVPRDLSMSINHRKYLRLWKRIE